MLTTNQSQRQSSSSTSTSSSSRVAKSSQRILTSSSSEMKASSMKSDLTELKRGISEMKNISTNFSQRLRNSMENLVDRLVHSRVDQQPSKSNLILGCKLEWSDRWRRNLVFWNMVFNRNILNECL